MKIKQNDTVQVLTGASRGKTGKVLKVAQDNMRVTVEGVNLRKKHVRPKKQGQKGQLIEFPAPLHISNVALQCPKCGKATRVGFAVKEGEKKRRVCKKCKGVID